MPVAAVLFDLFGTLVQFDPARLPRHRRGEREEPSTLPVVLPVLATAAPEVDPDRFVTQLAIVTREIMRQRACDHVERPSRERFARALQASGCEPSRVDATAIRLSRRHLAALADATVLPPAHATLLATASRRWALAVVSNFDDTHTVYQVLARHGILPHVRSVVVSEGIGLRKPHPELVHTALRELETAPRDACFVGDTFDEDMRAAHAAGVRPVWLTNQTPTAPLDPPAATISALDQLVPLLET